MGSTTILSEFAKDTLKGLTATKKFLNPKYFYDEKGSRIFQQIMRMPEYYLTDSELDIFSSQSHQMAGDIMSRNSFFDLIELGPGDGLKSKILLKTLIDLRTKFQYIPVDISSDALHDLVISLRKEIPELSIKEQMGDYFQIMQNLHLGNGARKVILFLGSNIGNFLPDQQDEFLKKLAGITATGDMLLIGFDLKKSPGILMNAYDDPHGYTRDFNLNHLVRINSELDADFITEKFLHHVSYNPDSGAMESYLVSKCKQSVHLDALNRVISFKPWECIFMELSQKFSTHEITHLAGEYGFQWVRNFTDRRNFFTDSLWIKR